MCSGRLIRPKPPVASLSLPGGPSPEPHPGNAILIKAQRLHLRPEGVDCGSWHLSEPRGLEVVIILVGVGLARPGGEQGLSRSQEESRTSADRRFARAAVRGMDSPSSFFLMDHGTRRNRFMTTFTSLFAHSFNAVHRGPSGGPKLCQGAVGSLPGMAAPSWTPHTGWGTGHCHWATQTRQPCWSDQG